MLDLLCIGSASVDEEPSICAYADASLIDLSINYSSALRQRQRRLTQFRLCRRDGAFVSFEIGCGLLFGIEMLGIRLGAWDSAVEHFTPPCDIRREVPLVAMELDGKRNSIAIHQGMFSQDIEFEVRYASRQRQIEIVFGAHHHAYQFGDMMLLCDADDIVTGLRAVVEF